MDTTEITAWLRLSLDQNLKPAQKRLLLKHFSLPENIYSASITSLAKFIDSNQAANLKAPITAELQSRIDASIDWLNNDNCHLISLADMHYPHEFFKLSSPPIIIYAKGQLATLKKNKLAVVGARSATHQGMDNSYAFAQYLAERNWCIISGLASGIDASAHRGALASSKHNPACTIAVLGTGIDLVYPRSNLALAQNISQHGLLISEFPLGYPAKTSNFPQRNRLVAALSLGVLVVEATVRSGSLITARLAGDLGKEVYAIPGSIHSPQSRGCHQLIRQGAKLVESGQDIIEELSQADLSLTSEPPADNTNNNNQANDYNLDNNDIQVLKALGYEATSLEALQERSQLNVTQLMQSLTTLELNGLVSRYPNGQYIKKH